MRAGCKGREKEGRKEGKEDKVSPDVSTSLACTRGDGPLSPVRGKELLAELYADDGVPGLYDCVSKGDVVLAADLLDKAGEGVAVRLSSPRPGSKIAHLSVVAVVCEPHLWPDVEDPAVEEEEAAVVECGAVEDGHAHVAEDAVCRVGREDLCEDLPGVEDGVGLEEVVEAAVAWDLELWTDAQRGAGLLGERDGLEDALAVAVKVERPLVERARRDGAACGKGRGGGEGVERG